MTAVVSLSARVKLPWLPCCARCAAKHVARGLFDSPPIVFNPPPPWMLSRVTRDEAAGDAACPSDPPAPDGYRVWTGRVPTELSQWAVDLLRHVNRYEYGTTWTMPFGGVTVLARKDHHTWTWRGGKLVTGICIPGITLYTPLPPAPADTGASVYEEARWSEPPEDTLTRDLLLFAAGVASAVTWYSLGRDHGRRRRHA